MWVRIVFAKSRAKDAALLAMLALASRADRDGVASIPKPALARMCRVLERHVNKLLAQLCADGELLCIAKGGGRGNPSRYKITLSCKTPFRKRETVSLAKGV